MISHQRRSLKCFLSADLIGCHVVDLTDSSHDLDHNLFTMSPQPIFGTASFGMDGSRFQQKSDVSSVLIFLQSAGVKRLHSGARYPPLNPGRSEQLIGESKAISSDFLIDTKVLTDIKTDGSGDLTSAAIDRSVSGSLSRLQRTSEGVNVLHIHRADPSTPVREQVHAFNTQIERGRCKAWGVSNVPIPMLKDMFRICEQEKLHKPVCYQGEYNMMTRGVENELLALLREHGVAFNAFRPLASGFLTGKFITGNHHGTRFSDDNPLGKAMKGLYGAQDLNIAMAKFLETTAEHKVSSIEVAVRWIFHHSALKDQDGVILGASRRSQVEEVLAHVQKGPLSESILQAVDALWDAVSESRAKIT